MAKSKEFELRYKIEGLKRMSKRKQKRKSKQIVKAVNKIRESFVDKYELYY